MLYEPLKIYHPLNEKTVSHGQSVIAPGPALDRHHITSMVLHLSPSERKLYDRERNRRRGEEYRQRQKWKAEEREAHYGELERRNEALVAQSEQIKAWAAQIKREMQELRDNPPERVVEREIIVKEPTVATVVNIASVLKLCRDAQREGQSHWLKELWCELEPILRETGCFS